MSDSSERRLATAWRDLTAHSEDHARFITDHPSLYWALCHWQASNGQRALASLTSRTMDDPSGEVE